MQFFSGPDPSHDNKNTFTGNRYAMMIKWLFKRWNIQASAYSLDWTITQVTFKPVNIDFDNLYRPIYLLY